MRFFFFPRKVGVLCVCVCVSFHPARRDETVAESTSTAGAGGGGGDASGVTLSVAADTGPQLSREEGGEAWARVPGSDSTKVVSPRCGEVVAMLFCFVGCDEKKNRNSVNRSLYIHFYFLPRGGALVALCPEGLYLYGTAF